MTRRLGLALLLPFALAEVRPQSPAPVARQWTQTTFLDFGGGRLEDGGANTYIAADGSVRLINRWDFNNDGYLDLAFPSSHDNNHGVDSYVYWGKTSGFDPARRTRLPGNGASGARHRRSQSRRVPRRRPHERVQRHKNRPPFLHLLGIAHGPGPGAPHRTPHRGGHRRRRRRPRSRWLPRAGFASSGRFTSFRKPAATFSS